MSFRKTEFGTWFILKDCECKKHVVSHIYNEVISNHNVWQFEKFLIDLWNINLRCSPDPTTNSVFHFCEFLSNKRKSNNWQTHWLAYSRKFVKNKFAFRCRIKWTAWLTNHSVRNIWCLSSNSKTVRTAVKLRS